MSAHRRGGHKRRGPTPTNHREATQLRDTGTGPEGSKMSERVPPSPAETPVLRVQSVVLPLHLAPSESSDRRRTCTDKRLVY